LNSCNNNNLNITLLLIKHEGTVNGAKYHTTHVIGVPL